VRSDLSKPARGKSRADLVAPNGEVLHLAESLIDLSNSNAQKRALFQGLPYKGEGVYRFLIHYQARMKKIGTGGVNPLKVMLLNKDKK